MVNNFLELTSDPKGNKVFLNTGSVVCLVQSEQGTEVWTPTGVLYVEDSTESILQTVGVVIPKK